jgi:hypothetical protein
MKTQKVYSSKQVSFMMKAQRNKSSVAVMDLFFALRKIKGTPTLKDLVKLARRIKRK